MSNKDTENVNLPAIVLPREPYYKDNYARRLSRMSREARLLARAIKRSSDRPKPKYDNTDRFIVSRKEIQPPLYDNHIPREWR